MRGNILNFWRKKMDEILVTEKQAVEKAPAPVKRTRKVNTSVRSVPFYGGKDSLEKINPSAASAAEDILYGGFSKNNLENSCKLWAAVPDDILKNVIYTGARSRFCDWPANPVDISGLDLKKMAMELLYWIRLFRPSPVSVKPDKQARFS
jgi:hypothetical protein